MQTSRPSIRDVRNATRELKEKIHSLPTVTPEEAKTQRARQITHTYQTRRLDQCEMLLRTIGDFATSTFLLVRHRTGISLWRLPVVIV